MPFTSPNVLRYLLKGSAFFGLLSVLLRADIPAPAPFHAAFSPVQLQGETNIWQITQTPAGQIIIGGEQIGFYENNRWEFISSPRKQAIRGLLVDGNSLWVASLNEIGRLELPLTRTSHYEPLSMPELATAGEFWQLAKSGDTLVATTKDAVWFIDPRGPRALHTTLPNQSRLGLFSSDGKLILLQPGVGHWEIKEGKLEPFENPLPNQKDDYWLWGNSTYILTSQALYKKDPAGYRAVTDTRALSKAIITSVVSWDKFLAVATYTKGLALIDPDSGKIDFLNRATGLTTLAATTAFSDKAGRLWVGTDQGLTVFESLKYGHQFAVTEPPLSATRANGLIFNYEDHADYYHSDGIAARLPRIFAVKNTRFGPALGFWGKIQIGEKEFQTPGNRIGVITELSGDKFLVTAGARAYFIGYDSGKTDLLDGLQAEISGLVSVDDTLWVSTLDRALYRAPTSPPFLFTKIADLPNTSSASLYRLGPTLIFVSRDSVRYGLTFSVVANTQGLRNPLLAETDGTLWLTGEQDGVQRLGRLRQIGGVVAWETVEAKGLPLLSEVHYFSAGDGLLTFSGNSTVLELNPQELKPAYRLATPDLLFTFRDAKTGEASTLPSPPAEISADKSRITFSGSLPFDEFGEKPAFERRLLPTESEWITTRRDEVVSYPSLSAQTYTLQVRAKQLGHAGPIASFPFTILPPWYASKTALASDLALAALAAYLIYRLRTHQIRRHNLELERLIAERTRELAKASAAKSEFLASMSHEIRNPMNGVIGLVTILRDQTTSPKQANTLKMLHNCAEQLRSTVDDILDFSKIEAGGTVLQSSTFDLRDTLEAAAATVDPAGTTIRFLDPTPPHLSLQGDAGKLRQIFANYLSNALKYGIPPEARVSTILTPGPGGVRLTLGVTSSGPTIDKDTLDKFFESFTRGEDAKERNIRGTGLGLAICKRYAEAMGGETGAVSTNGETTFYLTVPFAQVSAEEIVHTMASVPSALPARALAIEDEDYNRIVLGSILAKMNYSVDWATTGQEALRLARENGYDIILTDYRLPDTNGVELTKEILRFCSDPKPAVFAVTAYSTRERREECMAAGMAGFISKPITLEKLRATLAGWGEKNLARLSLEVSRPSPPSQPPAAIGSGWEELKRTAATDPKKAADLAHRLNNLCRSFYFPELAEQLELLEGALERGEPAEKLIESFDRLLHPTAAGQPW
jgi:signal transduction histidine kinase/CheY-like chemotaxis protein